MGVLGFYFLVTSPMFYSGFILFFSAHFNIELTSLSYVMLSSARTEMLTVISSAYLTK